MKEMTNPIAVALLIFSIGLPGVLSGQDSVEEWHRLNREMPLRWENIEDSPEWVSGEKPRRALLGGKHEVVLAPGQHICVRIPPTELLRMVGAKLGEVDIALSTGTGLLAFTEPVRDGNRESLLVDPQSSNVMLAHVMRPEDSRGAVRVALFVSNHIPGRQATAYRQVIDLGPHRERLSSSRKASSRTFWPMNPGEPVRTRQSGPARFALQTRFRYPANESQLTQTYRIRVRDSESGSLLATVEYATGLESADFIFAGERGQMPVVGRLETGYFDLDTSGETGLTLESSGPVYARLLRLEAPGYLVPAMNAAANPPASDLPKFQQSIWEFTEADLREVLRDPRRYPAEYLHRAAMRFARDNRRTEGGMVAANLLRSVGSERPEYPVVRDRGDELFGFWTYFRDVLPEGASRGLSRRAYFLAPRLRESGDSRDWVSLSEQHTDAALARLPAATFHPLRNSTYRFPQRSTPTTIRIAALAQDSDAYFWLQLSGESPRRFLQKAASELPLSAGKPTISLDALSRLDGATLDAPMGFRRENLPLESAGYFELTVPAKVGWIRLWSDDGSPVAVQYRTSGRFALSEAEYLSCVRELGGQDVVFPLLARFLSGQDLAQDKRAIRELTNHWEPLRRFLSSRCSQFADSVAAARPEVTATLKDARVLLDEGEYFLGERLLRWRALYADDDEAWRELAGFGDGDGQLLTACAAFAHRPDRQRAARLSRLLREQGEVELALMLAVSDSSMPLDLRLSSTFLEGWWAHFSAVIEAHPASPVSHYWRGLRLWREGDRGAARRAWEQAGADGQACLRHEQKTRSAREKISNDNARGLLDWAQAEASSPGARVWKPVVDSRVEEFSSAVTMHALERDKYFTAYVATPNDPLKLHFTAPGNLRIECRAIHSAGTNESIDAWVFVDGPEGRRRLPVTSSRVSPGLQIVGWERAPGILTWDEFSMEGWNSRLVISPMGCDICVRVFRSEPEVETGHLPPLRRDTADWLLGGRQEDWLFAPVSQLAVHPQRDTDWTEMADLLWQREHGSPEAQRAALARAHALASDAADPEPGRVLDRISRRTVWEQVLTMDRTAGMREVETPGWLPEDPAQRRRFVFLPKWGLTEQFVSGRDSAVAVLAARSENQARVRIESVSLPFLPEPPPLRAEVRLGDEKAIPVTLPAGSPAREFEFTLPAGSTSLRVTATDTVPNQYLKLGITAEREPFERKTKRTWFVSTQEQPLETRLDGPVWIRIDRWEGGRATSAYRLVEDRDDALRFGPGLYRLHTLRLDPEKPYVPPAYMTRAVGSVAPALGVLPWLDQERIGDLRDGFALGGQEDGTWTLGTALESRRVREEDEAGEDSERFLQGDLTYRYFDEPSRTWFRTTTLGREREAGAPLFGLEHSMEYRPYSMPVAFDLGGTAFRQDSEWALGGRGSVSVFRDLSPKLTHGSSISAFFRALSLDGSEDSPWGIDQDIFTAYKADHLRGMRLRDWVGYTPWEDTRLRAGVGLSTNEDFNPLSPDFFNYSLAVDQRLGRFGIGADLRGYRFFSDDDRGESAWRHRLNLEATSEFWLPGQQRIEVGVGWTRFLEEQENAVRVFGRIHFGGGRMFRDFRPGEKRFETLRERLIPHDRNNSLGEAPQDR